MVRGRSLPLLLELPPYRLPTLRSVLRQMFERASVFLKEAGTVILACTVVLWALLTYPKPATPEPLATHAVAAMAAAVAGTPVDIERAADNSAAVSAWQADKLSVAFGGIGDGAILGCRQRLEGRHLHHDAVAVDGPRPAPGQPPGDEQVMRKRAIRARDDVGRT